MLANQSPFRSKYLLEIFGLLILAVFIFSEPNLCGDPGVGWHLRTGELIAQSISIPRVDSFLLESGKSWISNQWLADLFLWIVFSSGRFVALTACVWLLPFLSFFYLLKCESRRLEVAPLVSVFAFILLLGAAYLQWFVRPVIFSFALLCLLSLMISRLRAREISISNLASFALLFIVWANLHPAFVIGLFLVTTFAVENLIQTKGRSWLRALLLVLVSLFATLVTPYGLDLWRNTFQLVGSEFFMRLNLEWRSPNFHDATFKPFLLSLLVLLFGIGFFPSRISLRELFNTIVLAAAALTSVRYIPFFAVVATPVMLGVSQNLLSKIFPSFCALPDHNTDLFCKRAILSWAGFVIIISAVSFSYLPGWQEDKLALDNLYPKELVKALSEEASLKAVRLYHTPNLGGYITWLKIDGLSAWIDDRNELNGEQIYRDYFSILNLQERWQEVLKRYSFTHLLLEKGTPIMEGYFFTVECAIIFEDEKFRLCRVLTKLDEF